jgi:amidohydrolase
MQDFHAAAARLRGEMIARRRDLHQHPELAFEETRTAALVAEELGKLGLEVRAGVGKTGVVGLLSGAEPGPTVLLRCDMDALPIQEENDTPYRSQTPNKMHACGHDGHTTVALAVAKLLAAEQARMQGQVMFVFQPAEEIGQGARAMLNEGVWGDDKPVACFGMHVWPELPVGEVIVSPGALMSGAAIFQVEITGKGSHAARPHLSHDPLMCGVQLVNAYQSIISRNLDPIESAVLSVTQFQAGQAFNVIPSQAVLKGTFRTFTAQTQALIIERLESLTAAIAQSMGCEAKLTIDVRVPPLYNDGAITDRLLAGYRQTLPDYRYHADAGFKTMESEDVAYFLEAIGGTYLLVGSGYPAPAWNHGLHHPEFDLNEEVLVVGASLLAGALSDYVLPH